MEGRAQEVKDKLRALSDCLLVDLVWEDLIEIIGLELFVLVSVPQPHSRLHAIDVLFLDLDLCLPAALQLQDIVAHV